MILPIPNKSRHPCQRRALTAQSGIVWADKRNDLQLNSLEVRGCKGQLYVCADDNTHMSRAKEFTSFG